VGSVPVLKPREVVALLEGLGFIEARQRDRTSSFDMLTAEARPFHFTAVGTYRQRFCGRSLGTSVSRSTNYSGACSQRPNNTIQQAVCIVTPRACARVAPTHSAADRERYSP